MIVPLMEAAADTCGGKGGTLGALLRAGLPVPDGFVVPFAAYLAAVRDLDPDRDPERGRGLGRGRDRAQGPGRVAAVRRAIAGRPLHTTLIDELGRALGRLGDPPVAVRSSASGEDTGQASAAGQHESFLAVQGAGEVARAVRACWASLWSPRAIAYRGDDGTPSEPVMAVIVQRHLDAEVSGVMFTSTGPDGATEIEASWGLGPSVVGGTVTPDAYRVAGDGTVTRTVADKRTRLDRQGARLVVRDVPADARNRLALDDATAARLAALGEKIATVLGGPQDVEWAIADGHTWVLQSRPITAALPRRPSPPAAPADVLTSASDALTGTRDVPHGTSDVPHNVRDVPQGVTDVPDVPDVPHDVKDVPDGVLTGAPGSRGMATGPARIVRGPGDFARVRPGDILVCPFTDPAWTPLLRIAAGVVTETGGVLSHAAIVAREQAIPAVLGVPDATGTLHDGILITIDGATGTVTTM
ncbi:PEP/pyruvate-binding domain-containing protein [Nonomuraea rubra]|uniref:Pyruvate,water dikinase n=1 Tax=Nonomuraea rubra TaxID=46180 RepID=A0A7X0U089_9ACTN|nr:PEP/pyruvate-binding domain-containing protein [Nonomuraea rubra]MBB6550288.1 pyruvate,water dikinase [Nonomuraea rubra]